MESELGLRRGHGFHEWLMASPAVTSARISPPCPTPGTLKSPLPYFKDESDSVCILLLFCSSFIPNPAVFAMFVSHPSHWLCRNDQGWEKWASFCSGNKCLILFHQDTWTKNKDYTWISRWLLKYLLFFFFFWARKKRKMFRHFILILIPYLVSYPVETMILPHIYKMPLLIIQSLGSASADSTNIRWKIVGKTILESSRRQSLDLRGFGL